MGLFCLFGYHKPGFSLTNFKDGLFAGKLNGIHLMNTSYKCISCGKFFNIESTLEIRDKFNVMKRNDIPDSKVDEITHLLINTTKPIKDITKLTGVSETTVRRINKQLSES